MKHQLPPLPYDHTALEPYVDARTMQVHHDMHHATYVKELNKALQSAPESFRDKTATWLLLNSNQVPEDIRAQVRNNAGGHVNHSFFWRSMAPAGNGGGEIPASPLAAAIDDAFGSFKKFKDHFEEAGKKVFGSGWVWLAVPPDRADKLRILITSGHDNPIMQGYTPLLVNDVWEHAYYLKYENRRPEYLQAWWSVVNWQEVSRRFGDAGGLAEQEWEDEGGLVRVAE
jgi:Fe-Mn family superoxide dismutase